MRFEDRLRRRPGEPLGSAVDVEPIRARSDVSAFEQDPVGVNAPDATGADDVLDTPELTEFDLAPAGHAVHRRIDGRVHSLELSGFFRSTEEVRNGRRRRGCITYCL